MALEDHIHLMLSRYIAAPQWVKTLAGRAYATLPLVWRRGSAYRYFQAIVAQRDPAAVAAYARQRLAETLRWAVEMVPAYRDYAAVASELEDPERALSRFPLVSKADIKRNLLSYASVAQPVRARLPAFTGGSTAEPMRFFLHKHVTRPKEYAFMEDFHGRVGYRDGEVVLALRGRTVPMARKLGGSLWMYEPIKRQLILSSDHLERRWMSQYVQALQRWRPTFIQAFPSALYPLARWLAANPEPEVTSRIRGVMLYSEMIYDYQMTLFRSVFRCPVLTHYGHSERVLMAASMPDDRRYFFWPHYGYFELADAKGMPINTPGVLGEIVGTSYNNQVMPFIRYRTGDMAMLSNLPAHPSLPSYPTVERIEGRLQEFVVCRDGRLISVTTLGAAHFEELANVEKIQYEQREAGVIELKVVSQQPLSPTERDRIGWAIKEKTQGGCVVTVKETNEILRTQLGKHVMLIQHLDLSRYFGAAPAMEMR